MATDYEDNSMASRMNSDGTNDLNRIKIDPQTPGEKFSFNVDIVAAMARKRADFKDNSMASRMNAGDSKDLNSNCIRIDPRTGEKFSLNVDIVAATAWQHPQQSIFIHARSFIHFIQWEGVFVAVLYITSLSTNEIGRYLTYLAASTAWQHPMHFHSRTFIHTFHPMGGMFVIVLYITSLSTNEIGRYLNYIQNRKSAARGMGERDAIVAHDNFLGPCMYFLVTSYTQYTIA